MSDNAPGVTLGAKGTSPSYTKAVAVMKDGRLNKTPRGDDLLTNRKAAYV